MLSLFFHSQTSPLPLYKIDYPLLQKVLWQINLLKTFHPKTGKTLFRFTMLARLSNAFKAHPVILHKHLDLNSMKELPESHAWTPIDGYSSRGARSAESVPVIDLEDPNALRLVGHACKTWGVFQVTNHGISTTILDDMEAAGRKLFSLPIHQKLKAARSPDGASGYGVARISSFFPKLMWSEGFTIIGSPYDHAHKLWPHDYNKFWYTFLHFHARISTNALEP